MPATIFWGEGKVPREVERGTFGRLEKCGRMGIMCSYERKFG